MVLYRSIAALLAVPALVLAAPAPLDYVTTTYTTVEVIKTIWAGEDSAPTQANAEAFHPTQTQAPVPTTSTTSTSTSPPPPPPATTTTTTPTTAPLPTTFVTFSSSSSSSTNPAPTGSTGTGLPTGAPGKVNFKNNCGYGVRIEKVPPQECGAATIKNLTAGELWTDDFVECDAGNYALKVYKLGADDSKPMHYEYGIKGSQKMAWYNLSWINCVSGHDLSQCIGDRWAIASGQSCPEYQCSQGESCCTNGSGYCDPTATELAQQPVGGCGGPTADVSQLQIQMQVC